MASNPRYSVLMSVYAKENPEWLNISLQSIINQTIPPSEFVLVKDGPLTSELNRTISNFAKKYPKLFKIIELEKNIGLGPALKIGIENCHNELILRMDSDDYSVPERAETQLAAILEHPELDIVGSNVNEFENDIHHVISRVILPEKHADIYKFAKKRCPFRHPSLLYRKSAVLKVGNYRAYYLCEDYDLYNRMLQSNCKCHNIQKSLTYMRIDANFYRRRGGITYLRSIFNFKKAQLQSGFFSKTDFIKSIIPHVIVCLMPNTMRDWTYRNLLRKEER